MLVKVGEVIAQFGQNLVHLGRISLGTYRSEAGSRVELGETWSYWHGRLNRNSLWLSRAPRVPQHSELAGFGEPRKKLDNHGSAGGSKTSDLEHRREGLASLTPLPPTEFAAIQQPKLGAMISGIPCQWHDNPDRPQIDPHVEARTAPCLIPSRPPRWTPQGRGSWRRIRRRPHGRRQPCGRHTLRCSSRVPALVQRRGPGRAAGGRSVGRSGVVGRLAVGRTIGRLVGRGVRLSNGRSTGRRVVRSVGRAVGGSGGRAVGRVFGSGARAVQIGPNDRRWPGSGKVWCQARPKSARTRPKPDSARIGSETASIGQNSAKCPEGSLKRKFRFSEVLRSSTDAGSVIALPFPKEERRQEVGPLGLASGSALCSTRQRLDTIWPRRLRIPRRPSQSDLVRRALQRPHAHSNEHG